MSAPSILVVGPAWIGDMVMAQSLLKLLKQRSPDAAIDVLAPEWSLPLIARMPEVRKGIVAPFAHGEFAFGRRRRLGHELRARRYDRAIILPRTFKSALVPWFARIPRRTGYRGEMRYGLVNDMRPFDPTVLEQVAKRYVALGLEPGEAPGAIPFPALDTSRPGQIKTIESLGLSVERPVVALLPGAARGPAKRWPSGHYAELAKRLESAGFAVWVLGGDEDRVPAERVAAVGRAVNLCGRTSLEQAIDLLAFAGQVVGGDSGLTHLAAAVGARVVALYGPTPPALAPPLTDRAAVHYLSLECSPCFKRECPLVHQRCLVDISPDQVLQSILAAR
jgi:heptosyltransferase-2